MSLIYTIEPDYLHPHMKYIYEEGENYKSCICVVYRDTELAGRIVDMLNKDDNQMDIDVNNTKEEVTVA